MDNSHTNLSETHLVGDKTREWIVRSDQCPALKWHHIRHVGIADAARPYSMVRTNLSGAYFLACFGGEGRILLDGRWRICKDGMACLAPPHVLHAFHTVPGKRWEFTWVRYEEPHDQRPIISSSAPVLARFEGRPLRAAVQGLHAEVNSASDPACIQHWVELIQNYVQRFAQPWHMDERLAKLWDLVDQHPERKWTVAKLSKIAHCSSEHLRRLCHHQLGRSPMHQVTYLRMRRAAKLLSETDDKISVVAESVGYENPFAFSNTFKRWIGWRPSEYRGWRTSNPSPSAEAKRSGGNRPARFE